MLRIQRGYLPVKSLRRALSFLKAYRIEESDTRGKIVVAARDIKKGELILEDNEPILHFPEPVNSGTSNGIHVVVAAFSAFMKELTPEKQRKYLTLYGPTTGLPAETIRNVAKNDFQYRFNREEGHRNLTPDEVETFVKVAQITRLNIFGSDADGNSVFEEMTRFAHSCDSSCTYMLLDKSIVCHATRSIKAGEELTISYCMDRDIKPIHERRLKYLEAKEFTCHCPRCSAPGDDTRQFDCVDPA